MLNLFMSLFSFNDATKKKTDIKIPNDFKINVNQISEKENHLCYDEEYDTFLNEFNGYNPSNIMKKTSSLLPKDLNTQNNREHFHKDSFKDNCSKCRTKIYQNFNATYHAYDRLWCYKCWSKLDINSN